MTVCISKRGTSTIIRAATCVAHSSTPCLQFPPSQPGRVAPTHPTAYRMYVSCHLTFHQTPGKLDQVSEAMVKRLNTIWPAFSLAHTFPLTNLNLSLCWNFTSEPCSKLWFLVKYWSHISTTQWELILNLKRHVPFIQPRFILKNKSATSVAKAFFNGHKLFSSPQHIFTSINY